MAMRLVLVRIGERAQMANANEVIGGDLIKGLFTKQQASFEETRSSEVSPGW